MSGCVTCGADLPAGNARYCSHKCVRFVWTEERIAEARRLYITEGRSASVTAAMMGGVTRSAIIGLSHRQGWPEKKVAARDRPPRVRKYRRPNIVWTDDLCARLRYLFNVENLTYGMIAERMDLPMSSVHRQGQIMGLKREHRNTYRTPAQAEAQRARARAEGEAVRRRVEAFSVITPLSRPWEERERGQCSWPIDTPEGVFSCCAPATGEGSVLARGYCEAHVKLGTVKPIKNKPPIDYLAPRRTGGAWS